MSARPAIAGCILAGGQSLRMGEDKASLKLDGQTLITRAIARLKPQVATLIISTHEESGDLHEYELPIAVDSASDRQGPLAGILAALRWAETNTIDWIATAAVDAPFFPRDLVQGLAAATRDKDMAIASSGGRLHPVFGLWKATLADELERQIDAGLRSVHQWVALRDAGIALWPIEPYDPFFNINQPDDVNRALAIQAEFRP